MPGCGLAVDRDRRPISRGSLRELPRQTESVTEVDVEIGDRLCLEQPEKMERVGVGGVDLENASIGRFGTGEIASLMLLADLHQKSSKKSCAFVGREPADGLA